jgi:hypothetical protein
VGANASVTASHLSKLHKGNTMNKLNITAIAAAIAMAISVGAMGATVTKSEYKASKDGITAKYKSDKAACSAMTGNAKDICVQEAKGSEKVAKAELEANYKPTDKNSYNVRIAKADAAYAVAKEKCDDAAGNAKDVCVKEAKAAHVAAKADAKVAVKTADVNATAQEKKVDANATARAKTADVKKDAAADKRNADYAVAKEKCDAMAGDAKANCIKDAKVRYGQS